jgi:hypothetical protein
MTQLHWIDYFMTWSKRMQLCVLLMYSFVSPNSYVSVAKVKCTESAFRIRLSTGINISLRF